MKQVSQARLILLLLSLSGLLAAQQAMSLTGPDMGFVSPQGSNAILPVLGHPGAAYLGSAVLNNVTSWTVSPDAREALAFKDGEVFLISAVAPSIEERPACCDRDSALRGGDWMPGGAGLIVWSSTAVHRLARSAGGLRWDAMIFEVQQGESIVSAVTGASGNVIVATRSTDANSLYFVGTDGVRLIYTAESFGPPVRTGEFACIVERARKQITRISLETASIETVADASAGLTDPVAATGLARDKDLLYVVSASDRLLQVLQLAPHRLIAQQQLEYEPCGIAEQPGGRYVRVETCGNNEPLLFVTAGQTSPVWFVPRTEVR